MSADSYTEKRLRITFILSPQNSNGKFPGTNDNTLVIEGARASVSIQAVPGAISTRMSLKVWNIKKQYMAALTTVFFRSINTINQNTVIVEADSGKGYTQVFSGMITEAGPVFDAMPNVYFEIQGIVGYQHQITPVPPSTYRGTVSVASIVEDLAHKMDYAFENDGVTAQISNAYYSGTYWDQLQRVCYASNTQYVLAGDTLAIYPYSQARVTPPIMQLSATSGLVGYPRLEKYGLRVTSIFNPGLVPGGRLQIVGSDIPNANGLWAPFLIDHTLESNMPGGLWHSVSQCMPVST